MLIEPKEVDNGAEELLLKVELSASDHNLTLRELCDKYPYPNQEKSENA